MTLRYDLHLNQGETFRLDIPVLDDAGAPVDITGMTARAQVRARRADTTAVHEWSTTAGNLTLASNNITLNVPAATSAAWAWRLGYWDLELTEPATSTTTRLVEGAVVVSPEITR